MMDEQISTWLIAYPYLTGCMAGWSSNRKISLGILAIGALFILPGTQSLIGELGGEGTFEWRIWGTVIIWLLSGLIFGLMANRYIRIVTVIGYIWTLGNAIIVTSITNIFFEGFLPFFRNLEATPFLLERIYSYLYILPVGILLVFGIGIQNSRFGYKSVMRKFAEFATILGLLELLSGQIWQTTLLNMSWWFTEMKPLPGYDWFFNFALMGFLMLPGYLFVIDQKIPENLGVVAVLTKGDLDPLNLKLDEGFSTQYALPSGWVLEKEERDNTTYNLLLQPNPRNSTSVVQITVFKFTEETISDRERLRHLTHLAIHANNGRIKDEFFTTCQGVLAHEVYCQTWRYEYLLHYIVRSYEVYVIWSSPQPDTFRNTIMDVQRFAETLHIQSKHTEEPSHA